MASKYGIYQGAKEIDIQEASLFLSQNSILSWLENYDDMNNTGNISMNNS